MKEISHIYLQIFREINEIISGDERLIRIIMKKLSEKEKIKIIFFDGMIKNCFCNVAESISNLMIKIFNSFKGSNIKDNTKIENLHNFYFLLMEIIFNDLPYDVEEKIEEISKDNYEDSYFESNYEKNIEYFFNTIQSLLNYLYIFKYDKNKFKKFIEYINKKIIPFIYQTNIKNNKIIQSLYEILYGGLCGLLFKFLTENENIELNLNYKIPLKNFLFNEIIFYQCIHKKTLKEKDNNRFQINSKFASKHINNLFILLIIKDFNSNKNKEDKKNVDETVKNFLSTLNDKHTLNFWIINTISSWKLNHKDKIKTNRYTGLKNLGNTCYMNSLVQMLFNLGLFRDGIVNCDYNSKETKNNCLFELKKLFFCLQYLDMQYYTPDSFPKNFENSPLNPKEQMDVDEFFANLMDKLETRLKGTNSENIIKYIFQGKQNDNLNFEGGCPHKRTNISDFYSIQLQVKDKKDIYQSLDTFIEGEYMSGDNSIFCDKCKKKFAANKNQDFNTLPRVLMFVLKRFEFDYNKMIRYKINDYFEFPLELDMNKYTSDYITGKNKNMNNKYLLRGVVIHSGTCEMGHYYSIIKNLDSQNEDWFLYNDSIVKKFDLKNLKEEAFGEEIKEIKKNNNDNINKENNAKEDKTKDNNNNDIKENNNNQKSEDQKTNIDNNEPLNNKDNIINLFIIMPLK
jgi:ubiquitin C-terminal hydrolase